jgi:hypothetical protein
VRPSLVPILLGLAAILAMVDGVWLVLGHFSLDAAGYLRLCLLSAALLGAARAYVSLRPDPRLAAMLFGTGFLCLFSLEASILNYLLLPHAGPRIDAALAALDRALGFDWPAAMRFMAGHPLLNAAALFAYSSMLPQVAALTIVLASTEPARVYRFCLALALSALICIGVWSLAPSFGAFSVYPPPPPGMALALDWSYAQDLVRLLRDGPGLISPHDARGLIGFPSYHAALALLAVWYAWRHAVLRWPALLLNLAVLAATPVQGGHHLVDVLGAIPVTAVTLLIVARLARAEKGAEPVSMVNKAPRAGANPVTSGLFRAVLEQKPKPKPSAIKRKLNAVP